jgi:hypothetical protein
MVTRLQRESMIVFGTKKCKSALRAVRLLGEANFRFKSWRGSFRPDRWSPADAGIPISCGEPSCPIAAETRL